MTRMQSLQTDPSLQLSGSTAPGFSAREATLSPVYSDPLKPSGASPIVKNVGAFYVTTPVNRSQPSFSGPPITRQEFGSSVPALRPIFGPPAPSTFTRFSPPSTMNSASQLPDVPVSLPFGQMLPSRSLPTLFKSQSFPGTTRYPQFFSGSEVISDASGRAYIIYSDYYACLSV